MGGSPLTLSIIEAFYSWLLDENARFAHTLRTHRLLCLGQNVAMLV